MEADARILVRQKSGPPKKSISFSNASTTIRMVMLATATSDSKGIIKTDLPKMLAPTITRTRISDQLVQLRIRSLTIRREVSTSRHTVIRDP
ncbi:hypothetical protein LINPERHAP1_LOCUS36623 [Linum perenne]